MKVVGLYKYVALDDEESLLDLKLEKPKAKGRDLLIEIKAISVNPIDTKVRSRKTEDGTPLILGWDASGIVVDVGEDTELFSHGDEVYYAGDITRDGTYSQYHLVDERLVGHKPKTLSFEDAAALPLTSLAAYESLFEKLDISKNKDDNKDKSILIINASGGVGSIATQLSKHVGLTVIGTSSRKETQAWAKNNKCDYVINHHDDLKEQLMDINITEVDYILILVSPNYHWDQLPNIIKAYGKVGSIVDNSEPLDLSILKDKSVSFVWEFMFTKAKYKVNMTSQHNILNEISKLVDDGYIHSTRFKTYRPFNSETLKEVHQIIETGQAIGKLVVSDFE